MRLEIVKQLQQCSDFHSRQFVTSDQHKQQIQFQLYNQHSDKINLVAVHKAHKQQVQHKTRLGIS